MNATAPRHPTTSDGSGAMFDRIARRYDLLNRVLSFGVDRRWRRLLVASLGVGPASTVLDLATGTADVAILTARRTGASVTGVDPSEGMLAIGREKVARAGLAERVELQAGDAMALEFPDASFDGATIAFGIRNVKSRQRGLSEMARVVRPGGRVAVLELTEPKKGPLSALARLHVHHVVPRLGALLSGAREYRYLQQSIEAFPPPDVFADMMAAAGLDVVEVRPLTFGVAHLFVGQRPSGAVD